MRFDWQWRCLVQYRSAKLGRNVSQSIELIISRLAANERRPKLTWKSVRGDCCADRARANESAHSSINQIQWAELLLAEEIPEQVHLTRFPRVDARRGGAPLGSLNGTAEARL